MGKRPVHTRPRTLMVHPDVLGVMTTRNLPTAETRTPTVLLDAQVATTMRSQHMAAAKIHMVHLGVLDEATTKRLLTAEVRTHMALPAASRSLHTSLRTPMVKVALDVVTMKRARTVEVRIPTVHPDVMRMSLRVTVATNLLDMEVAAVEETTMRRASMDSSARSMVATEDVVEEMTKRTRVTKLAP